MCACVVHYFYVDTTGICTKGGPLTETPKLTLIDPPIKYIKHYHKIRVER